MLFTCLLGWPVTYEQIKDVAEMSQVLEVDKYFLEADFRSKCEECIPFPEQVEPEQWADAFIYLKDKFVHS
jgi:hypothetical protein